MAETTIGWTNATWNPTTGCTKISPGCKHCYASTMHRRLTAMGLPKYSEPFSVVTCHEDALDAPLHWQKPRMIFVNSMSDLFHKDVPFEFVLKVYRVMQEANWHTYQILTKRPDRLLEFTRWLAGPDDLSIAEWPRHVWLGVSAENQRYADERIPALLRTPAAVRFVSVEPMLGPVDLRCLQHNREFELDALTGDHGVFRPLRGRSDRKLCWVICGGESGRNARPMHPDWARSLRDQCASAGVPFFWKQWGEFAPVGRFDQPQMVVCAEDGWSGNWRYAEMDAHQRESHGGQMECPPFTTMYRVGKKAAGNLLDGVKHEEFPEVRR